MSAFVAALDSLRQRYRCCICWFTTGITTSHEHGEHRAACLAASTPNTGLKKIGDDLVQMVSTKQKDNDHPPALVWLSRYDLPWADDYEAAHQLRRADSKRHRTDCQTGQG